MIFLEIITDAMLDSVKLLPFLFAAYWLIEYIECRHSDRLERVLAGGGHFGFVPGALLGLVPQCGFSAMAANLYASRVITLGTLFAVFVATSDEAVPILLASPGHWRQLTALLAVKLAAALLAGAFTDFFCVRFLPETMRGGAGNRIQSRTHGGREDADGILPAALKHTFQIFAYIFAFNLALGALGALIGEDTVGAFLAGAGPFQPFAAALVGLVPNCASSILLTQLYMSGRLTLGGAAAGLCTGAGVGLAVLFRANRSRKQNLLIAAMLYAAGVAAGIVINVVL